MTTFKCPEYGKTFEFSPDFRSEGCVLVDKCPFCKVYVELTSDKIVTQSDRTSDRHTT